MNSFGHASRLPACHNLCQPTLVKAQRAIYWFKNVAIPWSAENFSGSPNFVVFKRCNAFVSSRPMGQISLLQTAVYNGFFEPGTVLKYKSGFKNICKSEFKICLQDCNTELKAID